MPTTASARTAQPQAYRFLAEGIRNDARSCGTFWGPDKVFLATIPGIDLADAECTDMLADLRQRGLLQFARADLVGAMDAELVRRSEWREDMGFGIVTETHFLVVR